MKFEGDFRADCSQVWKYFIVNLVSINSSSFGFSSFEETSDVQKYTNINVIKHFHVVGATLRRLWSHFLRSRVFHA